MIKKINLTFFSNSRSEFGLINQILNELKKYKKFNHKVILSGTHFSKEYGNSIDEIKKSNVNYLKIFKYDTKISSEKNIIKNLALNALKLPKIFKSIDYVVLFGDRIELIPILLNCMLYNKKIIHFGGGEETKGSIDNKIRKLISSIADLHFVSSKNYKSNLVKMGISNNKIFNVGTLSVNKKMILNKKEKSFFDLKNKNLVSLTYHPVNINNKISEIEQLKIILTSLKKFKNEFVTIINAPGYEKNSDKLIKFISEWVKKNSNFKFYQSLGIKKYSSLIQESKFVIGNSSSGLIMAPFFKVPSINIGNRQDGRIIHSTVINCKLSKREIIFAIKKILSGNINKNKNRFLLGNGNAAEKSVKILRKIL